MTIGDAPSEIESNRVATLPQAWWTFVQERFEPLSTGLMLTVFVGAHVQISQTEFRSHFSLAQILLWVGVVAFFFKLRLYDEIKDYDLDCKINPSRPLPRRLLKISQVQVAILVCIIVELICFFMQGWSSFFGMVFVLAYSLLMYNEFFLSTYLRPHLTTYALLHTASCGFLSLAVLAYLKKIAFWELPLQSILFALASWCVFNVFEFGRKTFATSEERENVESYSLVWVRFGAVALVAVMVGITGTSLAHIAALNSLAFKATAGTLFMAVLGSGVVYSVANTPVSAKIYRTVCSLFIVLTFLAVMLLSTDGS